MVSKKILVAVDRGAQTELVFSRALELATEQGSELTIVLILPWESEEDLGLGTLTSVDLDGESLGLKRQRLAMKRQEALTWLESYRAQAEAKEITTTLYCQFGEPGLIICKVAREQDIDLIILGRRGHRGIKEIVLGSVSNYVIHHAPCSVLVVQGEG